MRYPQAPELLRQIIKSAKTGKTVMKALALMQEPLPYLGRYKSGSIENLLWRAASGASMPASKRLLALEQLLSRLAASEPPKPKDPYANNPLLGDKTLKINLLGTKGKR